MCEVISLAVMPQTAEVLWSPGKWHHHEICEAHGLQHDQVFKPEFSLATKRICFQDGPIALKRNVPPEFLQELLTKYDMKEAEGQQILCELKITHQWEGRHHRAVMKWAEQHVPNAKALLSFSEHTFQPREYSNTINKSTGIALKFHEAVGSSRYVGVLGGPEQTEKRNLMVRSLWQKVFEQPANRVPVWV